LILGPHSSFLQQAAHLSGGIYLKATKQEVKQQHTMRKMIQ